MINDSITRKRVYVYAEIAEDLNMMPQLDLIKILDGDVLNTEEGIAISHVTDYFLEFELVGKGTRFIPNSFLISGSVGELEGIYKVKAKKADPRDIVRAIKWKKKIKTKRPATTKKKKVSKSSLR